MKILRDLVAATFLFLLATMSYAQSAPQPYIASFTPASGPVGTVVTITGTGLTALTAAWVGTGHDAAIQNISATSAKITVPQDAATGLIALGNGTNWGFSGSDFTVTTALPQPYIASFTPASGPPGTVVTLTGTGLTALTAAWVGTGHDAAIQNISATSAKITVPQDAATGLIAVGNGAHWGFSGSNFTVAGSVVPVISSGTPTSGPVGTVVTLTGSGFTGVTSAKIGSLAAAVSVVSDTSAKVTIPTGASSGTISLTNSAGTGTWSTTFSVTGAAVTITSISPTSGPIGTVVTVTGTGFTGATAAHIGSVAATVSVASNTSATVTIPTGASSGTISITAPNGTATSSTSFTVTTSTALSIAVQGNHFVRADGSTIQLRGANMSGLENSAAQGESNDWEDGPAPNWTVYATWKPNVVRLPLNAASWLGLNCAPTVSNIVTLEAVPADGSTGGTLTGNWTLPTGSYPINFNNNYGPNVTGHFTLGSSTVTWPALSGVRSNQTSNNQTTSINVMSWGTATNADHNGTYQATVKAAIAAAQAQGLYVILDLHWVAPKFTIGNVTNYLMPLGQGNFADQDMAIAFWTSIANTFGTQATPATGINNHAILFEGFNEPFLNASGGPFSAGTADQALGTSGTGSSFVNNSQGGTNYILGMTWNIASHQAMLNAIRATGAQNVYICNGNQYAQQLAPYLTYMPSDTLSPAQVALGWHPYPNTYNGNNPYPYTAYGPYPAVGDDNGYAAPSSTDVQWANDVLAAGHPLIATEDGGLGGTSATASPAEPHMAYMQSFADSSGMSYLAWQWNGPRSYGTVSTSNYLTVFASDGSTIVPIEGEGSTTYSWMSAHAP